jgi:hypothetical protein
VPRQAVERAELIAGDVLRPEVHDTQRADAVPLGRLEHHYRAGADGRLVEQHVGAADARIGGGVGHEQGATRLAHRRVGADQIPRVGARQPVQRRGRLTVAVGEGHEADRCVAHGGGEHGQILERLRADTVAEIGGLQRRAQDGIAHGAADGKHRQRPSVRVSARAQRSAPM